MAMMFAVNWDAVAAVSTAVASMMALIALVVTVVLYVRQRADEQAAQIREDVRSFTGASSRLIELLQEGSAFIATSWHSAQAVREHLAPDASVADAKDLLKCEGIGRSIEVAGWGQAPQARDVTASIEDVLTTGRRLSGDLNILSVSGDLLRDMAQDMSVALSTLLSNRPKLLTRFLEDTQEQDLARFLAALATDLHANTKLYFLDRYSDAVRLLDQFISTVAAEFSQLNAKELIAFAQSKSPLERDEKTRTGSMRNALARQKGRMRPETYKRLTALLAEIEESFSKDAALKQLAPLKLDSCLP